MSNVQQAVSKSDCLDEIVCIDVQVPKGEGKRMESRSASY